MDPQKTPPSSPDSEKSTEEVTGSTGADHTSPDPKPWDVSPSSDSSSNADAPASDTSSASADPSADRPVDAPSIYPSSDGAEADKPATPADSWNSDKPADDKPAEGTPSETDAPKPPEVVPPLPGVPAPAAPAAPAWPAPNGTVGNVMPASASVVGGVHKAPGKKGLLIGLVIALVILVLGGGAAAAYFGYVVPNKPENVLKTALVNTFSGQKVQSQHFDGKVSVKDKASNMTLSGTFTGGSKNDGAFEVKADVDAVVTKVTVDARSVDGSTYYLKVGGLEGLPELLSAYGGAEASAYAPIIAGLNNQWIEINESILSQIGLDTGTLKMTQADRDKIAAAYTNHQFLTTQEKLADEKISGMASYHYKVVVDKAKLKDFMSALKDAKLGSLKVSQDDLSRFNDSVKDVDFSKYPIDLWITKDTKLIDQMTFTFSDDQATLNIRYTALDFNKPVTVTKPSGTKSLLEVMTQLFVGAGGDNALMQQLQGEGISL